MKFFRHIESFEGMISIVYVRFFEDIKTIGCGKSIGPVKCEIYEPCQLQGFAGLGETTQFPSKTFDFIRISSQISICSELER